MKRALYILLLICTPLAAQDYTRMSERTIMGTARYVGMGGAMTAIGGDPSAVRDNAAGLGLYRRAEVLVSMELLMDQTVKYRPRWRMPQVSWVISILAFNADPDGVQFNNIMFSYHRLHVYDKTFTAQASNAPSLGALLAPLNIQPFIPFCADRTADNALYLREYGDVHEFAFNWAMNIADRWYIGAGIQGQAYTLSSYAEYDEIFAATNSAGWNMYNRNVSSLILSGGSTTASIGLLYRPTEWFRFGFGLQTPSVGGLNTRSSGSFTALTDSLCISDAPSLNYGDGAFHRPMHTSLSTAFQIGAYGMLALQYDNYHIKNQPNYHSLRAGIEVIPVMGMYINLGYAYESTFQKNLSPAKMDEQFNRQDTYSLLPRNTQYASAAIGYRGNFFILQAAYQFHWTRSALWAHENADPYEINNNTHRVVITLGWHQ